MKENLLQIQMVMKIIENQRLNVVGMVNEILKNFERMNLSMNKQKCNENYKIMFEDE
jgi:hypothetical protein